MHLDLSRAKVTSQKPVSQKQEYVRVSMYAFLELGGYPGVCRGVLNEEVRSVSRAHDQRSLALHSVFFA